MPTFSQITHHKGRYLLEQLGFPAQFMGKKHGPCPLCGGKDRYRFTDYKKTGGYICNQCTPKGGDFAALAMAYFDMPFRELALQVEAILGIQKQPYKKEKIMETKTNDPTIRFLDNLRSQSLPATPDTPPALYLRKRGILTVPPTIRYLPKYKSDEGDFYPCLIARLDSPEGDRVTYKIIYLTEDGQKAPIAVVKKTLPCEREMAGCAVRLCKPGIALAIAEGVETALAYSQRNRIPAWSVDNANNMAQFVPPEIVEELIIVADTDVSFTGQAAAFALAKTLHRSITNGTAKTLKRVSVVLLEQSDGIIETVHAPATNLDYNDFIRQEY